MGSRRKYDAAPGAFTTICVRQRLPPYSLRRISPSQMNALPKSGLSLNSVTGPSGISPCTATPKPDSKWVSYTQRPVMLRGTVQCANSRLSSHALDRLAWNPGQPDSFLATAMDIMAGTSPSQVAVKPSELSRASDMQPVL